MKRKISSRKLSFLILTGMFILVGMGSGAEAKTTASTDQILPTADTYVDEAQPTTNYRPQTTMPLDQSATRFVQTDPEAYII